MMELMVFKVTPQRRMAVIQEISESSTPGRRFYVMVLISNMIAVLGLIANSPAVIIGAMLVAPLMTPIFGISLALIQGDSKLLARAMRAEIFGVILAVSISFVFGLLPLAINPTSEMLARTQPNLLDLMVAVLAGFAGAYAIVDERIGTSLPGVAIATAIVPPLANAGLCFALGEFVGGLGSFLLFLANVLSILLAASIVFVMAGMRFYFTKLSSKEVFHRFGFAILTFFLIAIGFTFSLTNTVKKRYVKNQVAKVITSRLSEIPGTFLNEFFLDYHPDGLDVLATVRTPVLIEPKAVGSMQEELIEILRQDVNLVVRNNIVKDIAATGSTTKVAAQTLDGDFIKESVPRSEKIITMTEQVLWETFSKRPGFQVGNIEFHDTQTGEILLANISCLYPLDKDEIKAVEQEIRSRLKDNDVSLIVSSYIPMLQTTRGKVLFEWHRYEEQTEQKYQQADLIQDRAKQFFSKFKDIFLIKSYFRGCGSSWQVLFEVTGTRMITSGDVKTLRKVVSEGLDEPIETHIWFRNEAIISEHGLDSYESFMKTPYRENVQQIQNADPNEPLTETSD